MASHQHSPSSQLSHRSRQQASDELAPSTPTPAHSRKGDGGLPPPTTFSQYKHRQSQSHGGEKMGIANLTRGVQPAGESGRRGFHPWHFLRISARSTSRASLLCNILWPVVPAALAVRYTLPDHHTLIFILAYIAMVPCANLIGFAGQELARKLPHVIGVLIEIAFGSVVEIVLFMVLLTNAENNTEASYEVIRAAILGSILATMLLCLGLCFFVGGFKRHEQSFDDTISEVGSGLLLTAGVVLSIPTLFKYGIDATTLSDEDVDNRALMISRIISILLFISYAVYVFFQARSHHGIYTAIYEYDEHRDQDKEEDKAKAKLTLTECAVALAISIALVTLIAITLVLQIEPIIEQGHVSDAFMGLILVPLVEKFAEHLTAIDEAYDNQMNFALSHVLGATLQTALFNAPLAVIVGWGLDRRMDLGFQVFDLVVLILAILTVGRFLQDRKSNYLEGSLLVILYVAIAVSAFYYPNPAHGTGGEGGEAGGEAAGGEGGGH